MTAATLAGYTLPLNFKYKREIKARIAVEETLTAVVVQSRPHYAGDVYYTFSCEKASRTLAENLEAAFLALQTVTFKDYDGVSKSVLIIEYSYEEVRGLADFSGRMKVMP